MRQCFYLGTDKNTGDGLLLASFGDGRAVQYWPPLMDRTGKGDMLTSSLSLEATVDITRQLSDMHAYDVPKPVDGIYVDWAQSPYYAGWHAWIPGYRSWTASKTMRDAGGALGITTCGEAYSAYQGWVEGALTSAEMMLQEHLGLTMPDWLADSDCLAPYQG